tara:strand:- start:5004 stop:5759 length:756 start_codon:yes stop_codon:yes gene_type:complete
MKNNLIFQYYLPYEANDSYIGGNELPKWAKAGSDSAYMYSQNCKADYFLMQGSTTDRYFKHLDPRLEALRVIYDDHFDKYDKVLSIDLDILLKTEENIFSIDVEDIAMCHEHKIHDGKSSQWMSKVMDSPGYERGIIAYGKKIFGDDWMFPKSRLYPKERFRYMNGGVQLWTRKGRHKARRLFTSIDDYYMHTRYTEQMYINLQLSNPEFKVTELDWTWNSIAGTHWSVDNPKGKFQHFTNASKLSMPRYL